MGYFFANLYDTMMRAEEEAHFSALRTELLSSLHGSVLEIGAGTGLNLTKYPASVDRLVLSEPDRHMRTALARKLNDQSVEGRATNASRPTLIEASAESLPFADQEFDYVVSTLVLCSVRDVDQTIGEAHRVLRKGGHLVLVEHVASQSPPVRTWQGRLEPCWRWLSGNCHLTRNPVPALQAAEFDVSPISHVRLGSPSLFFLQDVAYGSAVRV